jgi:hypothetical protein
LKKLPILPKQPLSQLFAMVEQLLSGLQDIFSDDLLGAAFDIFFAAGFFAVLLIVVFTAFCTVFFAAGLIAFFIVFFADLVGFLAII